MRTLLLQLLFVCVAAAQSLDEFAQRVISQNPEIKSLEAEAKALEEEALIAGKLDNPMLGIQVTNIDFADPAKRNIEPMQQIMYSLSQNIPLTSKLGAKEEAKKMGAKAAAHRLSQKKTGRRILAKTKCLRASKSQRNKKNI